MRVAIIGGGASGLMAAITAAERGARVTLFERQARVGRKLLATGNGRCNLTNRGADVTRYHGENPGFAAPALRFFGPEATLRFFESIGLVTVTEPDGRVYPYSDSASSVLDVLRFRAEAAGVATLTGEEVTDIKPGFTVAAGEKKYAFDRVIVACGGAAGGKLGGGTSGYRLLESLGHTRTRLYPALTQIKTDTAYIKALKGIRAEAPSIELLSGGRPVKSGAGEVQFTEYGVSGPAIFEISSAVSAFPGELTLRLRLTKLGEADLREYIDRKKKYFPALTLENLLTGLLHNRLGQTAVRMAGGELGMPISGLAEPLTGRIISAVLGFEAKVTGVMGFDGAQVTAGGIKTGEFDPDTMESRLVPGLYAAGEVLDIDGDCGGFNLQWAWSSGRLAGMSL